MAVKLTDKYFEWLVDIVARDRFSEQTSYTKLFTHLHNTAFVYSLTLDRNRALDGRDLRYRFSRRFGCDESALDDLPCICSVFEMMVALSIRCEEYIMDDPAYGDRTSQWFWRMISSLGLAGEYNSRYDENHVNQILHRFLDREYDADGTGGLFYIKDCRTDLRRIEIWDQLTIYLSTIAICDI